eukprot:31132-Pelagococcus_subviridis.AAC.4
MIHTDADTDTAPRRRVARHRSRRLAEGANRARGCPGSPTTFSLQSVASAAGAGAPAPHVMP